MATDNSSIFGFTTSFIAEYDASYPDRCLEEENGVFLFLSLTFVAICVPFGIVGNVMVFLSVYDNKSLRSANNALLVNLAVADIMTCTLSAPIAWTAIYLRFVGDSPRELSPMICSVQVHINIMSYSVQLATLALISIERHAAITHPFEKKKKRRRVIIGIIISWILGFLLGIVSALYLSSTPIFIICSCRDGDTMYTSSRSAHLYILTPLGILCFMVILCYYVRIFLVVRKHVKDHGKSLAEGPFGDEKPPSLFHRLTVLCQNCDRVNRIAPTNNNPPAETQQSTRANMVVLNATPSPPNGNDAHSTGSLNAPIESGQNPVSEGSSVFSRPDLHSFLSSSSDLGGETLPDVNHAVGIKYNRELITSSPLSDHITLHSNHIDETCVFRSEPNIRDLQPTNFIRVKPLSVIDLQPSRNLEVPMTCRDGTRHVAEGMEYDAVHLKNHLEISESRTEENDCHATLSQKSSLEVPVFRNVQRTLSDVTSEIVSNKDENVATESQIISITPVANVVGSVCVFNPRNRERGRRNAEAGTAKRAAYIIILFSLCWIPLFIVTLVNAWPMTTAPLDMMVFFSCTLLFSSTANPVVYTVVNRSFRAEFRKLIQKPVKWLGH